MRVERRPGRMWPALPMHLNLNPQPPALGFPLHQWSPNCGAFSPGGGMEEHSGGHSRACASPALPPAPPPALAPDPKPAPSCSLSLRLLTPVPRELQTHSRSRTSGGRRRTGVRGGVQHEKFGDHCMTHSSADIPQSQNSLLINIYWAHPSIYHIISMFIHTTYINKY